MKPTNLKEKHSLFSQYWHPHQIAVLDSKQVLLLLAKAKDQFVWHTDKIEDELFQVLKVTICMSLKDRTAVVKEGEVIVAPNGAAACPSIKKGEEIQLILFRKLSTTNTGEATHDLTQTTYQKI